MTNASLFLAHRSAVQGGTVGIIALAAAASLGPAAVFTVHNHNMLLRRAATFDHRGELDDPEFNPKEI